VSCDSIMHYIVVHSQCMRQIDVWRAGRTAAKTEASNGRGHWFDPSTAHHIKTYRTDGSPTDDVLASS
jgi:hypothetical protein